MVSTDNIPKVAFFFLYGKITIYLRIKYKTQFNDTLGKLNCLRHYNIWPELWPLG